MDVKWPILVSASRTVLVHAVDKSGLIFVSKRYKTPITYKRCL